MGGDLQTNYKRDSELLDKAIKQVETIAEAEIDNQNITSFYFNKVKRPRKKTKLSTSTNIMSKSMTVLLVLSCILLSPMLVVILAAIVLLLRAIIGKIYLSYDYKRTIRYFYKDFNKYNIEYMKSVLNQTPTDELLKELPFLSKSLDSTKAYNDKFVEDLQNSVIPQLTDNEKILLKAYKDLQKTVKKVSKCNSSLHILVDDIEAETIFVNLKYLYATKLAFKPTQTLHSCIGEVLEDEDFTNSDEVINCASSAVLKEQLKYWQNVTGFISND